MADANSTQNDPMHRDDAASYFKSCSTSFGQLEALFKAIKKEVDPHSQLSKLAGLGEYMSMDMENLADCWRGELKREGFGMADATIKQPQGLDFTAAKGLYQFSPDAEIGDIQDQLSARQKQLQAMLYIGSQAEFDYSEDMENYLWSCRMTADEIAVLTGELTRRMADEIAALRGQPATEPEAA